MNVPSVSKFGIPPIINSPISEVLVCDLEYMLRLFFHLIHISDTTRFLLFKNYPPLPSLYKCTDVLGVFEAVLSCYRAYFLLRSIKRTKEKPHEEFCLAGIMFLKPCCFYIS